jgi:hypothetical protein
MYQVWIITCQRCGNRRESYPFATMEKAIALFRRDGFIISEDQETILCSEECNTHLSNCACALCYSEGKGKWAEIFRDLR